MLKSQTCALTSATPSLQRLRSRATSPYVAPVEANPALRETTENPTGYVTGIRRLVYVALGAFFVALAVLGVALPGLPTTPFLLLASYFLSRSWPRLHQALVNNRVFGPILRDWQTYRGVRQRTKNNASLMICIAMLFLCLSGLPAVWTGFLLSLTLVGLVVIHRLPTIEQAAYSQSFDSHMVIDHSR